MRNKLHVMLVAGLLSLTASAAVAKPMIYTCHNSSNRNKSVIQGEIAISFDAATEQVFVSDPMILSVNGGPIAGKLKSDNETRIVFGWTVKNVVNSEGKYASLQFKGTYFKADGKFLLSMKPLGYDNAFEDRGSCTLK